MKNRPYRAVKRNRLPRLLSAGILPGVCMWLLLCGCTLAPRTGAPLPWPPAVSEEGEADRKEDPADVENLPYELFILREYAQGGRSWSVADRTYEFLAAEAVELSIAVKAASGSITLGIAGEGGEEGEWLYGPRELRWEEDVAILPAGSYTLVLTAREFYGSLHIMGEAAGDGGAGQWPGGGIVPLRPPPVTGRLRGTGR